MEQLIPALENADKGDRELDWLIAWHIGHSSMENARDDFFPPFVPGSRSDESIPNYSESIDAALTLVPEGCRWDIQQDRSAAFASVNGVTTDRIATPALALCIAALQAQQSTKAEAA